MKSIDIVNIVLRKLQNEFSVDSQFIIDDFSKNILKLIVEEFGIEFVSNCITAHPNTGYSVKYLDDKAPKLVAAEHKKNLDRNSELIKEILK